MYPRRKRPMAKKSKEQVSYNEEKQELTNPEMMELKKEIESLRNQVAQLQLVVLQEEINKIKVNIAQINFNNHQVNDLLYRQFNFKVTLM